MIYRATQKLAYNHDGRHFLWPSSSAQHRSIIVTIFSTFMRVYPQACVNNRQIGINIFN